MGTTERRFEMMKYLCKNRSATMSELADVFGVSVRTIKRDIDELGYLIPLETRTGRYGGGVYVMDGYRWDRAYMSSEDIGLLRIIQSVGEKQEKLILDAQLLSRLARIIDIYSAPSRN